MTPSQQSLTIVKFNELVAKLQAKYQVTNKPMLEFKNIGKSAGYFDPNNNRVVLNPAFYQNYADDMINNTLPHELAHAFAHYYFRLKKGMRIKSHGPSWASVMNFLGLRAERCHTYETDGIGRNTRPYSGQCSCDTVIKITKRMFNRVNNYRCGKCKAPLNRIVWRLNAPEAPQPKEVDFKYDIDISNLL